MIYQGICICHESYIVEARGSEHNLPQDKSNLSKNLNETITHSFSWIVICNAPKRKLALKILEAYFIATMKPTFNNQTESDFLHLFRNGIT